MSDAHAFDERHIGGTPLVELAVDVPATVCAKVEWLNLHGAAYGGGSVKSRIAAGMLDRGEERGELTSEKTVIEPTSGNTGSELARLAVARGYDAEIVMPDDAGAGKVGAVEDTGATVHFVDAERGYDATIERCETLIETDPERYYWPNQYANPANPDTHERTTAREIWSQTDSELTHFVAGAGTGGTVTGTGRGLHDRGDVCVVGFEPAGDDHEIEGLKYLREGDHYHPETYDESVLDEKLYVDTDDAHARARELRAQYRDDPVPIVETGQYDEATVRGALRADGQFLVGPSSGGGVQAVHELHERVGLDADDTVVLMLCDRGDKYPDGELWGDILG